MNRPAKGIGKVEFGLLPPEEIRDLSTTRIVTADTYDEDGYPIKRGLMDPRLGVIDPGLRCGTCGQRSGECPGHFGRVELARPVIHVGFARTVYYCLRSTCRECGRILLSEDKLERYRKKAEEARLAGERWWSYAKRIIRRAYKRDECPHCGEKQKKIKFEKPTTYLEGRDSLTPSDVRRRLEKISDSDAYLLGINPEVSRPEWMVLTVLPVPPVTVRPSITLETGVRSEDDLTHKLVDVIRINQRLSENIEAGAPHLIIEDLWELLQYHVTTFFTNNASGVPPARHRSGRDLRTLAQRLKGKEGRFRGNLSGKRVDFSARTVISPDPRISINEIGVPEYIARTLTMPITVTNFNLDEARNLVRRGPDIHPGATSLIAPDGSRYDLRYADREELANTLEPGWRIERHLKDGDIVLFNRQPSLHRMSIMAHEVRVMPGRTFRLNLSVCPPYNADFDGDEMNLHLPQSKEAQTEARILMRVQEQILSPRFGAPIIGGIQDHITGLYLLTRRGTHLSRSYAQQILALAGIDPELPKPAGKEDGEEYWKGKQIYSKLLPEDLNLTYKSKVCENKGQPCKDCPRWSDGECEIDALVTIEDGELVKGVVDAASYKALSRCEVLDRIVKRYGTDKARKFLDDATRLAIAVAQMYGFTTGPDDEDIPPEAREQIDDILEDARERVKKLIEVYQRGELEQLPGRSLRETLEMRIMEVLAETRDKTGEIAEEHLGLNNHAVIMARTGARGSMLNLTQMAGCVGQQSVRGERLTRGYKGRTLPHFKSGDLSADARGFASSNYKRGLNPTEFFFHSMGGREGLVDTAVRTAQSGYMQRRLINALQDLRVEHDGTVRDDHDNIVQFQYGEDSIDPARSDKGKAVNIDDIIEKMVG
ncbi:DNA-directed RNA polymerase subunit A' [candidate division MSBL1 archaeon SCGC-AAA261G05]|uniref:DNA-directed RNA polymerase subunit Rpo1N n=2 Tax=candidate division MSBL1 TaxID=215777 RepID=A0A133V176_9EURY|nr:DNA-directed RNA polymerase subunit A' [candidate division MSBL1 archaeon SCGC-AAA261C02]KXB04185.1 DNA-directed RNA polymerase subunit A' [candidate division MSBL1 archaeon SCGC-AAA261G05]